MTFIMNKFVKYKIKIESKDSNMKSYRKQGSMFTPKTIAIKRVVYQKKQKKQKHHKCLKKK